MTTRASTAALLVAGLSCALWACNDDVPYSAAEIEDGESACGNGVCEPGEDPSGCAIDCGPRCESGDARCNGEVREICALNGMWEQILCPSGEVCFEEGEAVGCAAPDDPDENNDPGPVVNNAPAPCDHGICVDANGPGFVCGAEGECVDSSRGPCAHLVGPLVDGATLIGTILPTGGPFGDLGHSMELAVALAVEEINAAPASRRPLAVIACNSRGNLQDAEEAAEHLTDLGVPAIIGPAFSSLLLEVAAGHAVPTDTLLISPSATSPLITDIDDRGLVWRTAVSDAAQAGLLASRLRNTRENGAPEMILLHTDEPFTRPIADHIIDALDLRGDPNAAIVSVIQDGDLEEAAREALSEIQNPASIVIAASSPTAERLIEAFEGMLSNTLSAPTYFLTEANQSPDLLALVAERPALQRRLIGTRVAPPRGPLAEGFDRRFQARHAEPPRIFAANAYDAAYTLAYTLHAQGGAQVTGPSLAEAFSQVVTGEPMPVAPDGIEQGFAMLAEGLPVDLEGVSGSLDFDLDTGDVAGAFEFWGVNGGRFTGRD